MFLPSQRSNFNVIVNSAIFWCVAKVVSVEYSLFCVAKCIVCAEMAGVSVVMDPLTGLGQLYLDMQDELSKIRTDVQSLRQENIGLVKLVQELRNYLMGLKRTRL